MQQPQHWPVAIVGGGPVGMMLALQLDRLGVACVIVNAEREPRQYPKGGTHNSRTMEHFRRLGLASRIRKLGLTPDHPTDVGYFTRWTAWELARISMPSEREKVRRSVSAGPVGQLVEPILRCNQMYVEKLVLDHVRSCSLIADRYGWTAENFEEEGDRVRLEIARPDGRRETITAAYLVGCDGGQSMLRKALGIRYSGEGFERQAYLGGLMATAHLSVPGFYDAIPHPVCWQYWTVNPTLRSNIVCLDGGEEFLFQTQLREGEQATPELLGQRFIESLGADIDFKVLGVGTWTPGQALVADSYGRGRVLLCGDAVHLFTPTGGFGLNTGVDDAVNLGWKLAASLQGWGGPQLLASYEAERRPVGFRNTGMAKSLTRNVGKVPVEAAMEDETAAGQALRAEAGQILANFAEEYASLGIQLGVRYTDSAIVVGDGSQPPADDPAIYIPSTVPGCRVPNLWFEDGACLYDRLGAGFTLIAFGGAAERVTPLTKAAETRGLPLELLALDHDDGRILFERDLVLVRPDTHVAWRGNSLPADCASLLDTVAGFATHTASSEDRRHRVNEETT